MSHESKSPSLGMLSTATRTTATVSPLTPSPLNGSIVPNGSPAASSTLSVQAAPSSSFAAALRKLAKQAEEPRGTYGAGWVGNGWKQPLGCPGMQQHHRHPCVPVAPRVPRAAGWCFLTDAFSQCRVSRGQFRNSIQLE